MLERKVERHNGGRINVLQKRPATAGGSHSGGRKGGRSAPNQRQLPNLFGSRRSIKKAFSSAAVCVIPQATNVEYGGEDL